MIGKHEIKLKIIYKIYIYIIYLLKRIFSSYMVIIK